jgi:hypothetical protein
VPVGVVCGSGGAVMAFAPTPYRLAHIRRWEDLNAPVDEHGNAPVVEDPPVVRRVYSVSQFGRLGISSREVISAEYAERSDTTLRVAVPDPTVYSAADRVLLWIKLDADGQYVAGTGVAYWVDGVPADDRQSPWPSLTRSMGGILKVRRVT